MATIKIPNFYDQYSSKTLNVLLRIRKMIYEESIKSKQIGPLEETLRWGQPTFLTTESKSGSMVRIDTHKGDHNKVGIYFHCQTKLIKIFRLKYSELLCFEGNRAIIVDVNKRLPEKELRKCLELALKYNLIKNDFK